MRENECPECHGRGYRYDKTCSGCGGTGDLTPAPDADGLALFDARVKAALAPIREAQAEAEAFRAGDLSEAELEAVRVGSECLARTLYPGGEDEAAIQRGLARIDEANRQAAAERRKQVLSSQPSGADSEADWLAEAEEAQELARQATDNARRIPELLTQLRAALADAGEPVDEGERIVTALEGAPVVRPPSPLGPLWCILAAPARGLPGSDLLWRPALLMTLALMLASMLALWPARATGQQLGPPEIQAMRIRAAAARTFHPVDLATWAKGGAVPTHVSVTGIVIFRRTEADGDIHIRLAAVGHPDLWVTLECIPELPEVAAECRSVRRGDRVTATGISRQDQDHNGQPEVHAVLSIERGGVR